MKREGPFFFKEKRGEHIKVGRTSQSLFVRACASYTHTHTHLYTSIGHAAAEFCFFSLSLSIPTWIPFLYCARSIIIYINYILAGATLFTALPLHRELNSRGRMPAIFICIAYVYISLGLFFFHSSLCRGLHPSWYFIAFRWVESKWIFC